MENKRGIICSQCEQEITGKYCSHCGQERELTRIDGGYILSEISSVLNFDKGILYTIRELLIRPGENIKNFIHKERSRLVKPIVFIIITSLIYMLAQQLFRFEDGYVQAGGFGDSTTAQLFEWIQNNYGYANILMAVFIAGWIRIFFRKYDYNIFEVLILLCFTMGIAMLVYTAFGIIETVTGIPILHLGGMIGVFYISWAIGRFFDKRKKANYLIGFVAYLLGMITFFLSVVALGAVIDMVVRG